MLQPLGELSPPPADQPTANLVDFQRAAGRGKHAAAQRYSPPGAERHLGAPTALTGRPGRSPEQDDAIGIGVLSVAAAAE